MKRTLVSLVLVACSFTASFATTVITKPPDVGPYWYPLSPHGTYVYADFFIAPNGDTQVQRLGTWLDDEFTGGAPLRFEIWGDNNGPNPSNVICSTGSTFGSIGTGLTYNEFASSSGNLVPGQKYWFAATCIGEANQPGQWRVGGHTQNSVYADNGTFWFSNDPNAQFFAGQNLTPEMAFSVTLGSANHPPQCSNAVASESVLWPPNHKYHAISILSVTDPDGDPVTITVTGITQDEPLNTRGDGNTCPDGQIVNSQASVRAERAGTPGIPGNGRVYVISFRASDGQGGECQGNVSVRVPHDQGQGSTCIDDGQTYNSLGPCNGGGHLSQEITEVGLSVGSVTGTQAMLEFALPKDTQVEVSVFDVAGRRLATVENGPLAAGLYQRTWDMNGATKGLYFVRLRAGAVTVTRTVVKIR